MPCHIISGYTGIMLTVDCWLLTVDCWEWTVNSELEFTIPMLRDLISLFATVQALAKKTIALPFVTGEDRLKLIAMNNVVFLQNQYGIFVGKRHCCMRRWSLRLLMISCPVDYPDSCRGPWANNICQKRTISQTRPGYVLWAIDRTW